MIVNGMNGMFANQSFQVNMGALVFGRSSSSCSIVFPDNTRGISRMHCKVEQDGMNCTITDLGSSYGTFVNGMKIQPYAPRILRNGDTFYLGDKSNMFSYQNVNEVMANGSASASNSVTYLNKTNRAGGYVTKQNNNKAIIGVIVAAVLVICVIAGFAVVSVQKAETARMQAEQELYDEQNKGFFGNLMDTVEDGFDLFY